MSNYSWISKKLRAKSIYYSQYELAWKITHADDFIDEALLNQVIVLGGDVLDSNLKYTRDNWYYEPNKQLTVKDNSVQSCNHMKDYINKYTANNGNDFYVIVICVTVI